jgi:ribonuclease Y
MDSTTIIISAVLGLAVGFAIAKFLKRGKPQRPLSMREKMHLQSLKTPKMKAKTLKKTKYFRPKSAFWN